MTTIVPSAELMQALKDLQQAVANVSTQLGLAPMASTLSKKHKGRGELDLVARHEWWCDWRRDTITGQTLAKLGDIVAGVALTGNVEIVALKLPQAATSEKATGDVDREPPTVKNQSRVEFPCDVTPVTLDDEGHNGSLDSATPPSTIWRPNHCPRPLTTMGPTSRRKGTTRDVATKVKKGRKTRMPPSPWGLWLLTPQMSRRSWTRKTGLTSSPSPFTLLYRSPRRAALMATEGSGSGNISAYSEVPQ
ncbi:hypothetical protein GUJ93_ZPchr0011g27324 [Zizania palustris]|uniref:Uncharacterized protein n=1 Tax=Zizania palustris TaxID=103762 RepID=A0A8J5WMA3_ZIZPA|nr:hypothetical protein GUJ93_ZPchr0011g27324 [Zizania palustris]